MWHQIIQMSRPFGLKKFYIRQPLNYWLCGQLHHIAERTHIALSSHLNVQKMVWEIVQYTFLNILCAKRSWVKIFFLVLMAHHMPTLMSHNGTVWRTCFGRGYGPILRQTMQWMNEWTYWLVSVPWKKLHDCVSKTMPCLYINFAMVWLHH